VSPLCKGLGLSASPYIRYVKQPFLWNKITGVRRSN